MSKATNVCRANVVTVNPLANSHSHYRKKGIFVGRNQLFCNAIYLKQFYTCKSHELQLFDKSVTIKGRADDRSGCFLYVLVS